MGDYDIRFELIDYKNFYRRIDELCHNGTNDFTFTRETPIGLTRCGFAIEHLKVGNGPIKIVYAAGSRGDEIAGVNFIFDLMTNIAQGNGCFLDFDPTVYTIDFLPCLNPEGYFTTTYAIKNVTRGMNEFQFEQFSRMFESASMLDDKNVFAINKCIKVVLSKCKKNNGDTLEKLTNLFWRINKNNDIHYVDLIDFLSINTDVENIEELVDEELTKWKMDKSFVISKVKFHDKLFSNVNLDCIPMLDDKHIALRLQLGRIYGNKDFDYSTLACYTANSYGVNLPNNSLDIFNKEKSIFNEVYGYGKYNNVCVSIPGPYGVASCSEKFEMEPENNALLKFIKKGGDLFIYCGGTGNGIYTFKKDYNKLDDVNKKIRESYDNKIIKCYKDCYISKGKNKIHSGMYPLNVNGIKKDIRDKYNNYIMLQFGLGANPLGFHFNREQYIEDVISYIKGNREIINTVLEYSRVNDLTNK